MYKITKMDLLYITACISLFCFGLNLITREGGFLSELGRLTLNKEETIYTEMLNPFIDCYPCMSSFWTVVAAYYFNAIDLYDIVMFVLWYAIICVISMVDDTKRLFLVCKWLYLVLVSVVLFQTSNPAAWFIVLMSTYGMNTLICFVYLHAKESRPF